MLHWFAGQRPSDGDLDSTGYVEPPETPAPVFAVRAFKHAIFGTPQTAAQPKAPRRHSNAEAAHPSHARAIRPGMTRPKSTDDTQIFANGNAAADPEPLPSPTKGILMTPGTAAARRKTVSFGAHVVDNEGKRQGKSGLPDDYPGKFPSPWVKTPAAAGGNDEVVEKPRGRSNKLAEALEKAREESAKRKSKVEILPKGKINEDVPMRLEEPRSEEGRYWKNEYDIYRANTTREVKKLVKKQQAAKAFARDKDSQCLELADQLRQEQKQITRLEMQTADLQAQLKALQEKLHRSQLGAQSAREEAARARRQSQQQSDGAREARTPQPEAHGVDDRPAVQKGVSELLESRAPHRSVDPAPMADHAEKQRHNSPDRTTARRYRARPHSVETKPQDDMWAQTFASSQLQLEAAPPSPKASRKITSGTDVTPLKSLSINTLNQDSRSLALSMGLQPPSPQRAKPCDSPMQSPDLPLPSPEHPPAVEPSHQHHPPEPANHPLRSPPADSSPFHPHPQPERPRPTRTETPPAVKAAIRAATKENIAPTHAKPRPGSSEEPTKPSSVWGALNAAVPGASAAAAAKRLVSKSGEEVGADRLAAAKARIAARGRVVS